MTSSPAVSSRFYRRIQRSAPSGAKAPVASSSTITVAEESADTPLGLVAPTDVDGNALTITVTGLPSTGTITLADGTPVTNGQVLTAAQLAGLQFDAPADLLAATSTSFTYSVSDGTVTVSAGTTISLYLRRLRIERAAELMASGRMNASEAALEVGYRSLSHFSQAFRAEKGLPPSEWLRAKRKHATPWETLA